MLCLSLRPGKWIRLVVAADGTAVRLKLEPKRDARGRRRYELVLDDPGRALEVSRHATRGEPER